MGSWIQELLKLGAGAAIGLTVYAITDSVVNVAGDGASQSVTTAQQEMKSSK